MRLQIKERLKPFTHRAGQVMLLPGTLKRVSVFPAEMAIDGVTHPLAGTAVKKLTVINDIEKCTVNISGFTEDSHFKKSIPGGTPKKLERLSFGSHKKQDWELIERRRDLKEILPIWFAIGQLTDSASVEPEDFLEAFDAAFSGMFVPNKHWDTRFGKSLDTAPEALLRGGYQKIRSLFFQKDGNTLAFLPNRPRAFACGRLIALQEDGVEIDIEWSNHKLRRIVLDVKKPQALSLNLPGKLKRFRLRRALRSRGEIMEGKDAITFVKGCYLLDRFEV